MLRSISLTGDRAGAPFILEDDQPRRTQQPFHDALPTEIHGPIVEEVTAASALPIIVEIAIDRSMLAPSSRRLISTPSNYTSTATCTGIMPLERSNTGDPIHLVSGRTLASTISFHLDDNPKMRETDFVDRFVRRKLVNDHWFLRFEIRRRKKKDPKKILIRGLDRNQFEVRAWIHVRALVPL